MKSSLVIASGFLFQCAMATALITHPDCLGHITPPGHAEQVARLDAVLGALEGIPLERYSAPLAADADILRAHPKAHLDNIRAEAPDKRIVTLDPDTFMSPGSLAAAVRGVGAVVKAVDLVLGGTVGNAFAAIRPPGHHAERETPMGFCLFGNIAIGAKHALDHHGLKRVAVVDFDVHHGNGTQDLLQDDPRVLFISSHEMPLYPGTGDPSDTGEHDNVINIALKAGTRSKEFREIYEAQVFPRLHAFKPDLILVSAGFDAHRADPLANICLETPDFAWVTGRICDIADEVCHGCVVSALEGGYDLEALADSAAAHVKTLQERAA
jgi:acetoin utilization deacetylase AcuC-like enzyme